MSDDLLGRVVGGRFRLESLLGAGGMGAVYVATDSTTQTRVAVKVIRDTLAESKEAIARFEREVQATEALHHPNIVRFLAAGQDGGLRYLAMELLEGSTLKERITSRGAIPWRETLPILRGVVQALDAAHRAGLIHRDLKPENVFLASESPGAPPLVKLLDFGVAKHTALPEGMTMTGTGIIVGTPGFVAPEVVLHGVADDPRSDFYALGATWFEMLTAHKPFQAATPFALAMRHLNETPPRPTTLVPFAPIPAPVEHLLSRLLAKTPQERPADARTLLAELAALEDASLTPLPLPSASDAHVLKTVTDMQTPRPDASALRVIELAQKSAPQTGFMAFPDGTDASAPLPPGVARDPPDAASSTGPAATAATPPTMSDPRANASPGARATGPGAGSRNRRAGMLAALAGLASVGLAVAVVVLPAQGEPQGKSSGAESIELVNPNAVPTTPGTSGTSDPLPPGADAGVAVVDAGLGLMLDAGVATDVTVTAVAVTAPDAGTPDAGAALGAGAQTRTQKKSKPPAGGFEPQLDLPSTTK